MPLPSDNMRWPPPGWRDVFNKYAEHAAWYSGDPEALADYYAGRVYTPTPKGTFWAAQLKEERRTMVHVPVAGDIAATNAALLFGEPPKIKIPEAIGEGADSQAVKDMQRLEEIIEGADVFSRLNEAAESCAALGGVFLKVNWDVELSPYPILSVAEADNAIPEFRHGFLTAVTLFKELPPLDDNGREVWRLVERHEIIGGKAYILTGLYRGTKENIGTRVSINGRAETAGMAEEIAINIPRLAIRYIPNVRPNRRFRGLPIGRSDYVGSEGLMDSLDEVYSSWVRDIRLAKGRIIVPEEWLKKDPNTGRFAFDMDEEVFTRVPDADPNDFNLTVAQFEIRANDHMQTALTLLERIVTSAGYSPQDFGLNIAGRAESGTALNLRRSRSFATQAKKATYWKHGIEDILHVMLLVDREFLGGGASGEYRPSVEMQDGAALDLNTVADALQKIAAAGAASIETMVRMVHPDWEQDQVNAEVQRIMDEKGLTAPNPDVIGVA